jgi:hypothetical protein
MALMKYNKNPIHLTEGAMYCDGVKIADTISATITFTPNVWRGKQLGEYTQSTRIMSYDIKVTVTRRRATKFLDDIIANYQKDHSTPEFTIQGYQADPNSEYYSVAGAKTVTAVGCVLTSAINVIQLGSDDGVVEDTLEFEAKDVQ